MAALGTVYWRYRGMHGGTEVSMMGVLGDVRRYWGAIWWEYRGTPGGTAVSH